MSMTLMTHTHTHTHTHTTKPKIKKGNDGAVAFFFTFAGMGVQEGGSGGVQGGPGVRDGVKENLGAVAR